MANRYWVGGAGTWDTTTLTSWSTVSGGGGGASVPTSVDTVIFDQAGTYTVSMNGALACLDFTVSAGTVTFANGAGIPAIAVYGSMTLLSGTIFSTTGQVTFLGTTTGKTITTNGTVFTGNISFNGVGAGWTLGSNLTLIATALSGITAGALNLNGFTITTGRFGIYITGTKSIAFGTGNIVLNHTTAATVVLDAANVTGFTWTGTGGFVSDAAITRTFTYGTTGGTATNAPNLTLTGSGTAIGTFTTGSDFNKLDFGTTAFAVPATALNLNALTLSSGGTFTSLTPTMVGTGTITPNGKTTAALTVNTAGTVTLVGALACTTYTQTAGTIDFATFNLTCSSTVSYVAGTLSNIGTITCTTWTVASGTFTMASGTITPSTSFVVSSGTVFNYNGGTLSPVPAFTNEGIFSLGKSYALTATGTYTTGLVGTPTLNLNGFNLSTGIFAGNNGIAVSYNIAFGTGNIILTHTTAGTTVLDIQIAQNINCSGAGGFVTDASITRTYNVGTGTAPTTGSVAPNLTLIGSGTAIPSMSGNCFNKLDFGTTAFNLGTTSLTLNSLSLSTGGTYTGLSIVTFGTGTITPNGKAIAGLQIGSTPFGYTGNTTLAGALSCTTFLSQSGTINFATFNLTCSSTVSYVAGTLSNIGTITCTTWTISTGTFTLTSGTITPSVSFVLTSGAFNYNGGTLSPVPTFTHTAGTVTLGQSYALTATGTYTLIAGDLNLGGFNLTTGIFSSSNSNTRSIAFGVGNIVLAHTTVFTTVLSMATATGFTWTGTGGFVSDAAINRSYGFGGIASGSATNAPNLTLTGSGTAGASLNSTSWFNRVDFGTTACVVATTNINVGTLILSSGGTYTGLTPVFTRTQTWTAQFSKQLGGIGCNIVGGTLTLDNTQTYPATSTTILTAGTLDLGGYDLTTGIFSSTGALTRSIAFGTGNIVLAHTTAAQTVLSMTDATGFTWTGTGGFVSDAAVTRTYVFGTTGGSATNAPNLSITSGAAVPTFTDGSWFNVLNFTGSTCTPAIGAVSLGINVSTLTLASGGTYTGLLPVFTRTQTWTAQFSKQLGGIGCTIIGGTLTLDSTQTYTVTSRVVLTSGTLDLGGTDLSTGVFASNNTNTRSIAFGANNIAIVNTTAGLAAISMATVTGFTWTGTGGFTADASVTRTFNIGNTAGGTSTNAPNLTLTGSGTAVLTFTTASWFNKLDFGTTAFAVPATALSLNALTLSSGGTFTSLTLTMVGTGTITPNGKTIAALTINNVIGTTTLAGALTTAVTATTTLTSGTLDLGGFTLTTGIFSSSGTLTRSIAFGVGNIVLATTTVSQIILSMATATGFTWTGTGGFVSDASVTRTFAFGNTAGGTSTNAPNLTLTGSGTAIGSFTTGSWFDKLDFGTTAFAVPVTTLNVDTLILSSGGTFTVLIPVLTRTQTWTAQFSKQLGGIGCNIVGGTLTLDNTQTYPATSNMFLTAGTLDLGGYDLTAGIFSSSGTLTRSIAFGANNIILAHTTTAQTVLSMANATGFTWTGTGGFTAAMLVTRTFTFGTTGGTTTNAPNLTLTGFGISIGTFTTASWFNKLDFGTTAFSIATTTLNVNGITLSTGGTFTLLTLTAVGTGTITPNGKTIAALTINCVSGTTTLAGALATAVTATTTLTSGTLDLGGFTLTTGTFSSNNTTARSIAFGVGNIVLVTTTAAANAIFMANCTAFTWTGTGGFVSDAVVTRTFTFGSSAGGSTNNAPNVTLTGSGTGIITFTTASWFNKLDFGTTVFNPGTTTLNVDSITLSTGGTFTALSLAMVGPGTITSNGKTIAALTINNVSSTTTLAGALACTTYTQTSGTIDFATFNLTCSGAAVFTSGTQSNTGTITCTTWTVNGTFTMTGGTITPSTGFILTSGAFNYNGGTLSPVATFTHTAGTVTLGQAYALTATGTYALTAGTLALGGYNLTTGIFSTGGSTARVIVFGTNNIILTHTTAGTTVLSMAIAGGLSSTGVGGFTADASITRTYSVGNSTPGIGPYPNLTITGSGTAVSTITSGSFFNKLDFGTTVFNPGTTTLNVNSITLSTGGTFAALSLAMVGTGTIAPNGKTIAALTVNSVSGTTTLAGALACTTYTQTSGTIDFATFNLTCSSTASYTSGALTNTGTITCTTWTVSGTFTMTNGTITPSTSFVLTSGAFNYNGGTLSPVATFTHTAGTVTLGQAYATGTYTLTAGTLALGGYDLATSIFSSTGALTRSIAFGANNISLTHTSVSQTVLSMANATGFTWTGTGGFTAAMSVTRTFTFGITGGTTTNAPNLTLTGSGTAIGTFTTGSDFNKLDFGTTVFTVPTTALGVNSITLSTGGTFTSLTLTAIGTGTIAPNGKTIAALTVNNVSGTTTLAGALATDITSTITLTSGTLDLGGFTLTTGMFSSSNSNTRAVAFGTGNIVLAYNLGGTNTLIMGTATGFTWTGTGGFTTDASITRNFAFGTTGGSATNAPNFSITSGAFAATFTTGSWFNVLDFTGSTTAPTTSTLNLNSIKISSGCSMTSLTINMVGTGTVTVAGGNATTNIVNINHSGTTTLASDWKTNGFSLNSGTLNISGYTLNPSAFSSGAAATRAIIGSNTGIILTTGNWTVTDGTGFTGSDYFINMTKATAKTFAGAGGSYGTLVQAGAGALTISGSNTFADIRATTRPATISFTAATTQIVAAFTLSGIFGSLVTINSTTAGSQFTLSKASGTVSTQYLSIKDSNATGADWYAGTTSTDAGNNTGWLFTGIGAINNSGFFMFF